MEFILLLLAPTKPKHKRKSWCNNENEQQQWATSSSLEPEATEGKRRRANPEEEAQRKQQKCDIRKQAYFAKKTIKFGHLLSRGKWIAGNKTPDVGLFGGLDLDGSQIKDAIKKWRLFSKKRNRDNLESSPAVRIPYPCRNRSGVVELVGREPLIIARVQSRERRDKIFAEKTENAKI